MVHPVLDGGLVRAYIISGTDGLMVIDPGSVRESGDIIPISSRSMPLIGIMSPEFTQGLWGVSHVS